MTKTPSRTIEVSVVIPVYANVDTLRELHARLCRVLEKESAEIVAVEDGSSDGSLALLERIAREECEHGLLKVVALARNYGQQAALCAGFEAARGRVIITLDADLQYPPEAIPAFVDAWRAGADLVCGYRRVRRDPLFRRVLPSRVFNLLVRWITGLPVRDVGCALNAIDARIARELPRFGDRRRFLKPLLAEQAHRIAQLPVDAAARKGPSSYGFWKLLGLAVDFFVVYSARPFRAIFLVGIVSTSLALVELLVLLATHLVGHPLPLAPWLTIGMVVLFGGFHLLTIGLLGESLHRLSVGLEEKPFYRLREPREVGEDHTR